MDNTVCSLYIQNVFKLIILLKEKCLFIYNGFYG